MREKITYSFFAAASHFSLIFFSRFQSIHLFIHFRSFFGRCFHCISRITHICTTTLTAQRISSFMTCCRKCIHHIHNTHNAKLNQKFHFSLQFFFRSFFSFCFSFFHVCAILCRVSVCVQPFLPKFRTF